MLDLALAILSSAMVSTVMRLGEGRIRNNMGMFVVNYLVCAGLSLSFLGASPLVSPQPGLTAAVLMGLLSGVLYLTNFVLLQQSIQKNGVVLSATFMKLGVLIPTLMAIIVFREQPRLVQLLGILLAVFAIVLVNFEKEGVESVSFRLLLIILLLFSGVTDSMANIYDKLGSTALKDHYLFYTFLAAAFCAFLLWRRERQSFCLWDVAAGICIGVPNYFSSRFLLLALHSLPAVIVYPVYSVMTIVVVTAVGLLLFRERLSRRKLAAILLIFVSLSLLNL